MGIFCKCRGALTLTEPEAATVVAALRELAAIKGRANLNELSERLKKRIKTDA